jgi:hypothetical protein
MPSPVRFDDATAMHGNSRVDQVAPKGPEASQDAIFVRASKPGVADDIGHQDRRKLSSLAHRPPERGLSRY